MVEARLELDSYTTRVLDVIKGKYGLKNRSEALSKFAQEYGSELVEYEVNDEVVCHFDAVVREHEKKYGKTFIPMKEEELDSLLGLDEEH